MTEALALHEEVLSMSRQLGDVNGIAASQWDLAQIYLQQRDAEQALPCLQESFQLLQQSGWVDGECGRSDIGVYLVAGWLVGGRNESITHQPASVSEVGKIRRSGADSGLVG